VTRVHISRTTAEFREDYGHRLTYRYQRRRENVADKRFAVFLGLLAIVGLIIRLSVPM
jgi:hypothetical protein